MTLLAVLTCHSATETAQRHFLVWRKFFPNIVMVTTVDKDCWVPPGVCEWKFGVDKYVDRDAPDDNLPRRTIQVLERFLSSANQQLILIEYDVVFFRKPDFKSGFGATIFPDFLHSPWMFDRPTAQAFVNAGNALLNQGIISGGWPDRHMRLMYDILKPARTPNRNYSRNTLDQPHFITEARSAIRMGAESIHGIKDAEQFNALMQWDQVDFSV